MKKLALNCGVGYSTDYTFARGGWDKFTAAPGRQLQSACVSRQERFGCGQGLCVEIDAHGAKGALHIKQDGSVKRFRERNGFAGAIRPAATPPKQRWSIVNTH